MLDGREEQLVMACIRSRGRSHSGDDDITAALLPIRTACVAAVYDATGWRIRFKASRGSRTATRYVISLDEQPAGGPHGF
ncbi:hypothetical protein D7V88_40830 [Corallococcus terminator]|uniref:Uncharacterized protein n=1 Tax=Corallococcus terminator TaxID=2316733 RepID=A0A3A8HBH3_9BACT|nr:hypothetical protein D7V88_40830 [Corallococcus terminator]